MLGKNGNKTRIKREKFDRNNFIRALTIFGGALVNVILFGLMRWLDIPMYLDTIGTVIVACVSGIFPAIITAVLTNLICEIFGENAVCFTLLNIFVAVGAGYLARRNYINQFRKWMGFALKAALVCGVGSALIQWSLFGKPQYASVTETVELFSNRTGMPGLPIFLIVNFFLNLIDKGLVCGIAFLIMRIVPEKKRVAIFRSGWRQTPLSNEEIRSMKDRMTKESHSLRARLIGILVLISLALVVIMGWIGIQLYFDSVKAEKLENAQNAARFASQIIDPEKVDDYLRNGKSVPGYAETEDMLYKIRDNASGVEYLYVLKIREDGCYVIFDLETEEVEAYEPGDRIEFEEAFLPYLPILFEGGAIDPIESDDISGWVLTVYQPVYDKTGKCVCYVGADISMEYMEDSMKRFLWKVVLTMSGFFVLILAFGMWTSNIYLVYPINSMVACTEDFMSYGDNPAALDESVERMKRLEIHTGDEVENLYHSLCSMSKDVVNQIKDIRHYSAATAQMQNGLIITMADMVENRDSDTGAHIQKTAAYVRIILDGLKKKGYYSDKLTEKYIEDVEMSAPLHDVGKISIPDAILNKPGKLTAEEYEIMKTHTTEGKRIMERAINTVQGGSFLKEARNMAAYHHEKWDGSGYPEGLYGEVIPLSARVMAVADVFDALVSKRVYKPPMPLEKALDIIRSGAGKDFDPKCVEVFLDSLEEVTRVMEKFRDQ